MTKNRWIFPSANGLYFVVLVDANFPKGKKMYSLYYCKFKQSQNVQERKRKRWPWWFWENVKVTNCYSVCKYIFFLIESSLKWMNFKKYNSYWIQQNILFCFIMECLTRSEAIYKKLIYVKLGKKIVCYVLFQSSYI